MQLIKSSALPAQVGQAHIQPQLQQDASTCGSTWGWLGNNCHFLIYIFILVPSIL